MQTTGNIGLKKPEYTDVADVAVFNANTDILDTEVAKLASTTEAGRMSAADKAKLNGVAAGANNYVHPTTHPASMITQDSSNRFTTDAEKATWNAKAGTTAATTSAAGLMSAADKAKLDGVATGANNYVAPSGSLTAKGDVQLSNATNSTSEALAATPAAVKAAYDRGSAGVSAAATAQAKADAALPASSYTAADVLSKMKTVDGAGSGLDADMIRGKIAIVQDGTVPLTGGFTASQPDLTFNGPTNVYPSSAASLKVGSILATDNYSEARPPYAGVVSAKNGFAWNGTAMAQTRLNNGSLEYYDGSGWQTVGYDPSRYMPINRYNPININPASAGTDYNVFTLTGKGFISNLFFQCDHANLRITIRVDGVNILNSSFGTSGGTGGLVMGSEIYGQGTGFGLPFYKTSDYSSWRMADISSNGQAYTPWQSSGDYGDTSLSNGRLMILSSPLYFKAKVEMLVSSSSPGSLVYIIGTGTFRGGLYV